MHLVTCRARSSGHDRFGQISGSSTTTSTVITPPWRIATIVVVAGRRAVAANERLHMRRCRDERAALPDAVKLPCRMVHLDGRGRPSIQIVIGAVLPAADLQAIVEPSIGWCRSRSSPNGPVTGNRPQVATLDHRQRDAE